MNHRGFKRTRQVLGVAALMLTITAIAATSSAVAATQHWATISSIAEEGGDRAFTGHTIGVTKISWKSSLITVTMTCTGLSTSGTASNPAGGGNGTLSGTSLKLTGCVVSVPSCKVAGGTILFEPLKGYARDEADEERVRLEPNSGTTMAVLHLENNGATCALAPEITVTGFFEAVSNSSQPGQYQIAGTPHLNIGTSTFEIQSEFALTATSGKPLALSSDSPGIPRWYLVGEEWVAPPTGVVIPAGESVSYFSTLVPFTLKFKLGLSNVEIDECQALFAGSVENPTGGGAGKTTSVLTPQWLGGCEISTPTCRVERAETVELEGTAIELGAVPAVEWTGSGGGKVVRFQLESVPSKTCSWGSEIVVTGRLIARSTPGGTFEFASLGLMVGKNEAIISNSRFVLERQTGGYLRIQP